MPQSKKVPRPQTPKVSPPKVRTPISDSDVRDVVSRVASTDRLADQSTSRSVAQSSGRGIVARKGRRLADGSRVGAGELAKVAIYLPTELAADFKVAALRRNVTQSDLASEAIAAYLASTAEPLKVAR